MINLKQLNISELCSLVLQSALAIRSKIISKALCLLSLCLLGLAIVREKQKMRRTTVPVFNIFSWFLSFLSKVREESELQFRVVGSIYEPGAP